MAKKKKKSVQVPQAQSDKSYIQSGRARKLPVYKCWINKDWEDAKIAHVIVARKHINGNVTSGVYLVDLLCTGVKDTFYDFNSLPGEFEERIKTYPFPLEEISYELAHNIIYGAVAFAQDYGIEPAAEFKISQKLLEEDTEDIELIELEFGRNGKPVLEIKRGGVGNVAYYKRQLEKHAEPGEYEVLYIGDEFEEDFDLEDGEGEAYPEDDVYPEDWEEEDWLDYFETISEIDTDDISPKDVPYLLYVYEKLELKQELEAIENYNIATDSERNLFSEEENNERVAVEELALKLLKKKNKTEIQNLINRVEKNVERWPNNYFFLNNLAMLYDMQDDEENSSRVTNLLCTRFPDYFFCKSQQIAKLFKKGKVNEVLDLLEHTDFLFQLFPNREFFTTAEVISYHNLLLDVYMDTANFEKAYLHILVLEYYGLDHFTKDEEKKIVMLKLFNSLSVLKKIQETKPNTAKTREMIDKIMA